MSMTEQDNNYLDSLFVVADDVKGIVPDESLMKASIIAGSIIRSEHFRNVLFAIFPTITPSNVYKYLKRFESNGKSRLFVTIKRIRCHQMQGASSYAEFHENSLYLSSLMLLEMQDTERELEDAIQKKRTQVTKAAALKALNNAKARHVIFLAVKLVHEMSHIINRQVNTKYSEKTPVKMLNGHRFTDFGEMVEFKLFGGIIEHHQFPSNHAFSVSHILSCGDKGSMQGHPVDVEDNEAFLGITDASEISPQCVVLVKKKHRLLRETNSAGSTLRKRKAPAKVRAGAQEPARELLVYREIDGVERVVKRIKLPKLLKCVA